MAEGSGNHLLPATCEMRNSIDIENGADRVSINTLQSLPTEATRTQIDELDDDDTSQVFIASFSSSDTLVQMKKGYVDEGVGGSDSSLLTIATPNSTDDAHGSNLGQADVLSDFGPSLHINDDNEGDAEHVLGNSLSSATPEVDGATSQVVVRQPIAM